MLMLYPKIKPFATHTIDTDDGCSLYVEESGRPGGVPVLVIHDGPGHASDATLRQYFDPDSYRIILFDQRGCGKSTPYNAVANNTTQHLIADIEHIRSALSIKQWLLFGGGWGSTLALVYAQCHPEAVSALLLWSIFLGTAQEIKWMFQDGANRFFPDAWQQLCDSLDAHEHTHVVRTASQRLNGPDELARMATSKAWASWLAQVGSFHPSSAVHQQYRDPHNAGTLTRLGCHYYLHHCFLAQNQIIGQIARLASHPCVLIHGRYDVLHPLEMAWKLAQHWPAATFNIVRDAGHCARDKAMVDALVRATNKYRRLFV